MSAYSPIAPAMYICDAYHLTEEYSSASASRPGIVHILALHSFDLQ